jgi:hypothetical protein
MSDWKAINNCIEDLTSTVLEDLTMSVLKCRPRSNQPPFMPILIQNETRLKNRLKKQWQVFRDLGMKARVDRLQRSATHQLNEWRNGEWGDMIQSLDTEDQPPQKKAK